MDFGNLTRRDRPPSRRRTRAEVVVIGGGHNGLVCAAYLARAGVDVLVLERNSRCGGALFSTTTDGFTLEHGAVDHSTIIGSTIPDELELARHGLDYVYRTASALHVYGDGVQIAIAESAEETARSIAEVDNADAEAWLELVALSSKLLALTGELTRDPPVPMEPAQRLGRVALGRTGRPILELARSSAVEVAEKWFRSPHLRALAVFRSQFSGLPPWYPGTGAVFCLTPAGHGRRYGRPRGGSRAFVDALQSAVLGLGGRVRCDFPVSRVTRADGGGWRIEAGGSNAARDGRCHPGRGVGSPAAGHRPPADRFGRRAAAGAAQVPAGGGGERQPQPVHPGRRAARPAPGRPSPSRVRGQPALAAARPVVRARQRSGRARRHPRRAARRAPHLSVAAGSFGGAGRARPRPGSTGSWPTASTARAAGSRGPSGRAGGSGRRSSPACPVCRSWSPARCSRPPRI